MFRKIIWPLPRFALTLALCFSTLACDGTPKLKPLHNDAVILAFGDSLTSGVGTNKAQAYPARLQELISRTVVNAGVPGETSLDGLRRLPALLRQHQPALVIICHGGNDILRKLNLQQTKGHIQQMIELSRDAGAQVVLIGVPKFGIFLSSAEFYSELAKANRLPLENDVLGNVLQKPAHKSDQVHPNADGYALIAQRLAVLLIDAEAIE
jgi:lysophospholipase L1-like esterase